MKIWNTMGNPFFFYFFKYRSKRSKRKFRIVIWTFSFEICFQNQFLTSGTRICVFSVKPLPKVKNWFRKQISKENVHITILKKFGAFRSVFRKVKKWISHCISNFQSPRADSIFRDRPLYIWSFRSHFSHIISMKTTKSQNNIL